MGKQKKIAKAPDGYEYIWVEDPLLSGKRNPDGGIIRLNKRDAESYQFAEILLERTGYAHTHIGRRCIFADMPVFEMEKQ